MANGSEKSVVVMSSSPSVSLASKLADARKAANIAGDAVGGMGNAGYDQQAKYGKQH
jgi:hypothetical protein